MQRRISCNILTSTSRITIYDGIPISFVFFFGNLSVVYRNELAALYILIASPIPKFVGVVGRKQVVNFHTFHTPRVFVFSLYPPSVIIKSLCYIMYIQNRIYIHSILIASAHAFNLSVGVLYRSFIAGGLVIVMNENMQ